MENELLQLSTLGVLSLLPVYHRFYDAFLLIFPLAWGVTAISGQVKKLAKTTLLLLLVFLVPGGSALEQLQQTTRLGRLQHSWWWVQFVMPHQIWVLLLLSLVLLLAMRLTGGDQSPHALPVTPRQS